jgi:hypothetical protein
MQSNEAILIVLLVVLIVVVAFQGRGFGRGGYDGCPSGCGCPRCIKGSFTSSMPASATSSVTSPHTPIQMQHGAIRGARHDAYNQDHAYLSADLAKNYRSWAAAPRDLEEAQRAAWFEAVSNGNNSYYNTEAGGNAASELVQHHTPGPSINYQDTLVDLVVDPRMRAQQANWHSEVAPKSMGAMKVDTLDEAAAMASQRGHGLYAFRFPAPSQQNPLFITDQNAESYGVHTTKFTFGG